MTNYMNEDLSARIDAVDNELRAGSTVLGGLLALLGSELLQSGILTDLGLPMGREGTAMHAVEVAHFVHTADLHAMDLVDEMVLLVYSGSESAKSLEYCRDQMADSRSSAQELLSITLNSIEQMRAGELETRRQKREMADAAKRVKAFIVSADASSRMLNYLRNVLLDEPAQLVLGSNVSVMSGEDLIELLSQPEASEQQPEHTP